MNRSLTLRRSWIGAAGLVAAVAAILIWLVFPGTGSTGDAKPAPLYRVAANTWNSGELTASFGSPNLFYDRTFPIASKKYNALYVTVMGTAHQTNTDILGLACTIIDPTTPPFGRPCDSYGTWVWVANTGANSWQNNSFSQTWCVTLARDTSSQRIQLSMGGPSLTNTDYIEHVTVYVDAAKTADACSTTGFVGST